MIDTCTEQFKKESLEFEVVEEKTLEDDSITKQIDSDMLFNDAPAPKKVVEKVVP